MIVLRLSICFLNLTSSVRYLVFVCSERVKSVSLFLTFLKGSLRKSFTRSIIILEMGALECG